MDLKEAQKGRTMLNQIWHHFIIGCCILWAVFNSSLAHAECRLAFRGLPRTQYFTVDAETIDSNAITKTMNFTVENSGDSTCYYFVTINEGISGDITYNRQARITNAVPSVFQQANHDTISYQLYSQSIMQNNIVKTLDHAVFDQNVLGPHQIKPGQTLSESFLIHVPRQNLPNLIAESYSDEVELKLYQNLQPSLDLVNDCSRCVEEDSQPLNLQFGIMDYVTLSIGKSYNPNTRQSLLDFGELLPNKQESFEVYVGGRTESSNTCSVTIASENGSKLKRKDVLGLPKKSDFIDYTVQAQSNMGSPIVEGNINLSTPNTPVNLATSSVPFRCGDNNKSMMAVDVSITIGDVEQKNAGIYRDTLVIEVLIGL